ncbi:hypothetical protein VTK73DRAFT_3256 [Phialemonium thermophilum]|uniref:Uncharacterized protein n=1 Tax=Phialemonium thermophilum TaxID=223376 RepID=A0ABR3Y8U6_9PEZI
MAKAKVAVETSLSGLRSSPQVTLTLNWLSSSSGLPSREVGGQVILTHAWTRQATSHQRAPTHLFLIFGDALPAHHCDPCTSSRSRSYFKYRVPPCRASWHSSDCFDFLFFNRYTLTVWTTSAYSFLIYPTGPPMCANAPRLSYEYFLPPEVYSACGCSLALVYACCEGCISLKWRPSAILRRRISIGLGFRSAPCHDLRLTRLRKKHLTPSTCACLSGHILLDAESIGIECILVRERPGRHHNIKAIRT